MDARQERRNSRARAVRMMDFTATSPTALPSSQTGSRASSRKSMFMPTVKKNRPSRSPLKGSMVVSIALRNSVSASSRPATKAPSAMEKPATAAATPAATITNSVVATNRSLMPTDATRRNSGRITTRPTMTMTPSAMAALANASTRVPATEPESPAPKIEMNSRSGATARSCASRIAKLARPALVFSRPCLESTSIDDGGRRQRQAGADDERHRRLAARKEHGCADCGCGEHDLQAAQSENQAAHRLQPLIGQFHADQEQQEHDAEVCETGDVLGVHHGEPVQVRELADKRTEPQGTEDRARDEIAEDGIEAEPAHQWNDDARSAEQDQGIAVDGNVDRRGHLSVFVSSRRERHVLNGAISETGIHRHPCRR